MEEHFDALGCAGSGKEMMTATAALQVNLDAGPASGWEDRLALIRSMVPMLVAASSTSPYLAGTTSGWHSMRQGTWQGIDHGRSDPVPLGEPTAAWATYALNAPVMLVHDGSELMPVTERIPFAQWLRGGAPFGRRPTMADLEYHLTTLFPPVRPRGYIELRCLDAAPDRWWPALAALTVTLVDDPVAADAAAELCAPIADSWETAARHGLHDDAIRTAVVACAELAARRCDPAVRTELEASWSCSTRAAVPATSSVVASRRPTRSPYSRRKPMREQTARGLESARRRTLHLTDIDEGDLTTQHSPLMSPLVWDLAHIGQQEDLWLLRGGNAAAQGLLSCEVERLYDAFEHPRATRVSLPLLSPGEARAFIADVRGRVFDGLDAADEATPQELFPYVMVEQHEQMHVETMLATHQLRVGDPLLGPGSPLPPGRVLPPDSVLVPAGPFTLGVDADSEPWSLDNERPAHTVDLPAFRIARVPVSNSEWQALHRRRWLRRPGLVVGPWLAAPTRRGFGAAPVLVRRRFAPAVRAHRGDPGATSRSSTSASSRPRPMRPGQVPGCPPSRSGRRRAPGTPARAADGAGHGVTRS